jgi:hypothetical protein
VRTTVGVMSDPEHRCDSEFTTATCHGDFEIDEGSPPTTIGAESGWPASALPIGVATAASAAAATIIDRPLRNGPLT